MDTQSGRKTLRYTLGALGLSALVGGAMFYYAQEMYDATKVLMGPGTPPPLVKSVRPLRPQELHNLSDSVVEIIAKGYDQTYPDPDSWRCLSSGIGAVFLDNQTKQTYIVLAENLCSITQDDIWYWEMDVETNSTLNNLPVSVVKIDSSVALTLLKVDNCYDCVPHFNGKIASSTAVGETFVYNSMGASATGKITYKGYTYPWGSYDLTDMPGVNRKIAVVIEDGKPNFIGIHRYHNRSNGSLLPLESLRFFIKGTPLEDELL